MLPHQRLNLSNGEILQLNLMRLLSRTAFGLKPVIDEGSAAIVLTTSNHLPVIAVKKQESPYIIILYKLTRVKTM
jgi:hypothetical protein